jgi:hypothetical protein
MYSLLYNVVSSEPEQIEKHGKDLVDNTEDTETDVEKQTIVARDVNGSNIQFQIANIGVRTISD